MSLQDWASVIAISVGSTTLLGICGKIFVLNPLKAYIKEQTYPIQPNANGGKSLPDIAVTVTRIETKVDNVTAWLTKVDERLITHLSEHGGK